MCDPFTDEFFAVIIRVLNSFDLADFSEDAVWGEIPFLNGLRAPKELRAMLLEEELLGLAASNPGLPDRLDSSGFNGSDSARVPWFSSVRKYRSVIDGFAIVDSWLVLMTFVYIPVYGAGVKSM